MIQTDPRRELLLAWLDQLPGQLGLLPASLRPASSDASFRRYFRIDAGTQARSYIVMDAPPQRENCSAFLHIARLFADAGVTTPEPHAVDLAQGFVLLSDLGETTYAQALQSTGAQAQADAPALYADALAALIDIQRASRDNVLPGYDRALLRAEMQLFPDWYVGRHLGLPLAGGESEALAATFNALLDAACAQPAVFVHRDYHSRNLMRLAGASGRPSAGAAAGWAQPPRNPGVLDFQDAVFGPITYDLVSLLRDAYVDWPEAQQLDWAIRYWELARRAALPVRAQFDDFWRDFEWMGLQRSLKVLSIFARLYHRDGKDRYLADLPLVLKQARRVAERYRAFGALARLLDRLEAKTPQVGYTF